MRTIAILMLLAGQVIAQECSHLWNKNLEINPPGPKAYVGDSWAAYGLMGYQHQPKLAWRFVGQFPRARFMSIETYTTEKKRQYDVSFDYSIEPSPGSENPFREGVALDTLHRDFEVNLVPAEGKSTTPNVIHISPIEPLHAIYYRIYVPQDGIPVTEKDLPKVYAYDAQTGEPMACPAADTSVIFAPDAPQALLAWVLPRQTFKFKANIDSVFAKKTAQGNNAAIPYYMFGKNRSPLGNVTVIRFKAPTFINTNSGVGSFHSVGDTRYWSLCTQNIVKGQTLNCLPDFLGKIDKDGFVNVAVGTGDGIREAAERRGFVFLEDKRGSDQAVIQFIYRALLPNPDFAATDMYQGDYQPTGATYTREEFLK